jgi:TolB-like protein/Tfp pilus assembly protein PilF
MKRLKRLIVEIHRRSLWQVLLIYCGAALVAYQAVQALTEGLGLPQWFPAFAIVLFIVGLPIVLATAFVHEVAPPTVTAAEPTPLTEAEAARVEAEAAADHLETRRRQRFLTWRNAAATFVIVLAAWGVVATGWLIMGERAASADEERQSIAVLPLENLSPDPDNAFFAAGIHEDILSQLSKIQALDVISRTSVLQYADTDKDITTIAEELGVDGIVEGSVRRAGEQVRVVLQLIDKADVHLWSETYDRDLTAANVFAIQSDIATQIARALEAEFTLEERERIEARPTDNLEAYDYYLRGNEYFRRIISRQNFRIAEEMYKKAIELDSEFALAYARISHVHTRTYWFYFDRTEERLAKAREAANKAFELHPDLSEAHFALGWYHYHGHLDYDSGLREFRIAQENQPNNSDVIWAIGVVQQRQGKFAQALRNFQRALELDPRSSEKASYVADVYGFLGDYGSAVRYYDTAIMLRPDEAGLYTRKAVVYLHWEGSTESARATLGEADNVGLGQDTEIIYTSILLDVIDGKLQRALDRLFMQSWEVYESPYDSHFRSVPKAQLFAFIYGLMGQPEAARAYYDTARAFLESEVQDQPEDSRLHSSLGIAYAGLGRKEEAVREGKIAVELMPVIRDALRGPYRTADLARIYTMIGEYDAAIDQIDYLLSIPGPLSVNLVRIDPAWDPLRDHPRFQALLEKYE